MKCSNCKTNPIKYPNLKLCNSCYKRINSRNSHHKDGTWSKYSNRCKDCRTDRVTHWAWGFCHNCYKRNYRKWQKAGKTSKQIRGLLKKVIETRKRCELCLSTKTYTYSGTELPVCYTHFQEWRQTVPCDGCGKPCLENAIETENDNILYWWHYPCWERACSTTQIEQLKALASAL